MDADDENSGWPISSTSRPPPKVLWAEPTVSQQMDAQMDSQMDTHMVAQVEDEAYIPSEPGPVCNHYISLEAYESQTKEYTNAAVEQLLQSPEYKTKHTRCQMCWNVWYEGQFSATCVECGGFAMERPCPVCRGKCGTTWRREVDMSHSHNEAHWDGECGLPQDEQQSHMMALFRNDIIHTDDVADDLKNLSTS